MRIYVSKLLYITLGTNLRTTEDFRKALHAADYIAGERANEILERPDFSVSPKQVRIQSAVLTPKQLGFEAPVTRRDLYLRAAEVGLAAYSSEGGPQTRLQYPNQPCGEMVIIGMHPIKDSNGKPHLFSVEHGDGRRLSTVDGRIDCVHPVDSLWMFAVPDYQTP